MNSMEKQIAKTVDDALKAVREFADGVLLHGRDVRGKVQSPMFIDGLDVRNREPVRWRDADGREWILSNFASQQILLRTLVGASTLTGDSRYRDAALDASRHALKHLWWTKGSDRMFAWGGHEAYNATDSRVAAVPRKGSQHELKNHYPFYEFLWEADPALTRELIEAIWNAHILDWGTLDFNRHGAPTPRGLLWDNVYRGGPVFFWGKGLTFLNAASDLVLAAKFLSRATGDPRPGLWGGRLAHRYVETRDPKTGLGGFQFSQMADAYCNGPGLRGDRAQYQWGHLFPGKEVYEGKLFIPYDLDHETCSRVLYLSLASKRGFQDEALGQIAVEDLQAWARNAFRHEDAAFIPMLTDGTSMEGLVASKPGYFGPPGRVVRAHRARSMELWAFALGYRQSGDPLLWDVARCIARNLGLGDIGQAGTGDGAQPQAGDCAEPEALFALLELYETTNRREFLMAAAGMAQNLIRIHFNGGFFTRSPEHPYAKFDSVEALALLHFIAAANGKRDEVPVYTGGKAFFAVDYGSRRGDTYDYVLYRRKAGEEIL